MKIFDCDRNLGIMINGTRYDSIDQLQIQGYIVGIKMFYVKDNGSLVDDDDIVYKEGKVNQLPNDTLLTINDSDGGYHFYTNLGDAMHNMYTFTSTQITNRLVVAIGKVQSNFDSHHDLSVDRLVTDKLYVSEYSLDATNLNNRFVSEVSREINKLDAELSVDKIDDLVLSLADLKVKYDSNTNKSGSARMVGSIDDLRSLRSYLLHNSYVKSDNPRSNDLRRVRVILDPSKIVGYEDSDEVSTLDRIVKMYEVLCNSDDVLASLSSTDFIDYEELSVADTKVIDTLLEMIRYSIDSYNLLRRCSLKEWLSIDNRFTSELYFKIYDYDDSIPLYAEDDEVMSYDDRFKLMLDYVSFSNNKFVDSVLVDIKSKDQLLMLLEAQGYCNTHPDVLDDNEEMIRELIKDGHIDYFMTYMIHRNHELLSSIIHDDLFNCNSYFRVALMTLDRKFYERYSPLIDLEVDELTSKKLKLYIEEHGVDYNN